MSADIPVFKASREWFDKFKKRIGIRGMVRHGKALRIVNSQLGKFSSISYLLSIVYLCVCVCVYKLVHKVLV